MTGVRSRSDADALVAGERTLPSLGAGKDDALAGFAADAADVRDGRAVSTLAGRSAAATRLEGLRRVEAFVCGRECQRQLPNTRARETHRDSDSLEFLLILVVREPGTDAFAGR